MGSFETLLVANRGEVAVRVLRTARRLGLRTVAVYSDGDRSALHVRRAHAAVALGPDPAYLSVESILRAARSADAGAIHPGWGFLSEDPRLAQACRDAGYTFIGPSASAMEAMADKPSAKERASGLGLPVLPHASVEDLGQARDAAERMGYPVLLKAAAGGGGRGMRRVLDPQSLPAAWDGARREAEGAFGHPRLFVEKRVPGARHVEVQVVGDGARVWSLGTRECSVQHRFQKRLEEAPCLNLPPEVRGAMETGAQTLVSSLSYQGLATVEFVLSPEGAFYFLEVNTRLQVEHPVTEAITGLDLVELQLRIARGEDVSPELDGVSFAGHAMEARLMAEDPARDFLPQSGPVRVFRPAESLRVDVGLEEGDGVPPQYDPMVAKLVAHHAHREGARRALVRGLEETVFLGPPSNREHLLQVLRSDLFRAGQVHTETSSFGFPRSSDAQVAVDAVARTLANAGAWAGGPPVGALPELAMAHARHAPGQLGPSGLLHPADGAATDCGLPEAGTWIQVQRAWPLQAQVQRGSRTWQVQVGLHGAQLWAEVDGLRAPLWGYRERERLLLQWGPYAWVSQEPRGPSAVRDRDPDSSGVRAPAAGTITQVCVQPSERVHADQVVVHMESMKLEQMIRVERTGYVAAIHVEPGQSVPKNGLLIELSGDPP